MKASAARGAFCELAAAADDDIDVAYGSLLIAAEEYPDCPIESYLARLDAISERAAKLLADSQDGNEAINRLNRYLFHDEGFRGNQAEYYDPRNCFLNEVLDRRLGIPISLAVIYVALGDRIGLPLEGINFPGHFLVKHLDLRSAEQIIIDPFFGEMLSPAQCGERLKTMLGDDSIFDESYLRPASHKQILGRLLTNLKYIYVERCDYQKALNCCERLLVLCPQSPLEIRERGMIYERLECFRAASVDYEKFLELAPEDPAAGMIQKCLQRIRREVGDLH